MPHQGPFPPEPPGGVPHEEPDGVTTPGGVNSLRDTNSRPPINSGDWQVRPPDLKPRGRP
jgi:hypothetical protein